MLRAFTLATRKLLLPRPLPVYTQISDAASSSSTVKYDVQWDNHRWSILPLAADHNGHHLLGQNRTLKHKHLRWASGKKGIEIPNPSIIACNMINMLKCVDLTDMKDSPPPMFWMALVTGGAQVVIPLLEILGGYSYILTVFQLYAAALTVASAGGIKWGLAISKNRIPLPNWDTMIWIFIPSSIALLGLHLPYPLGFLTVGAAIVSSLYLDLISCAFTPWGNAVRVFLAMTTLVGLSMALTAYMLFHDKENKQKKEKETKMDEQEDVDKPKNSNNDNNRN